MERLEETREQPGNLQADGEGRKAQVFLEEGAGSPKRREFRVEVSWGEFV